MQLQQQTWSDHYKFEGFLPIAIFDFFTTTQVHSVGVFKIKKMCRIATGNVIYVFRFRKSKPLVQARY